MMMMMMMMVKLVWNKMDVECKLPAVLRGNKPSWGFHSRGRIRFLFGESHLHGDESVVTDLRTETVDGRRRRAARVSLSSSSPTASLIDEPRQLRRQRARSHHVTAFDAAETTKKLPCTEKPRKRILPCPCRIPGLRRDIRHLRAPSKFHRILTQTKKYQSFVSYALSPYQ